MKSLKSIFKAIVVVFIVLLVISAVFGGSTENEEQELASQEEQIADSEVETEIEPEETTTVAENEAIDGNITLDNEAYILGLLKDSFKGIADITLDKKENAFLITPIDPAFVRDITNVYLEDPVAMQNWDALVEAYVGLSNSISMIESGYSIAIVNPSNTENVLLIVHDGVVVYNYID